MHEIERKFLVTQSLRDIVGDNIIFGRRVEQCYLPETGDWTVRVRRYSNAAGMVLNCVHTMKRRISDRKCIELETVVSDDYFDTVRQQCGHVLEKFRHEITYEGHTWEIDVFPQFDNLIVAEIELQDEDEEFAHPKWLGKEVTANKHYKNVKMAKRLKK
jgi:adenylate cyclase